HLLRECQDSGAERVAMEVSSHALDQHRIDGTHFAVVGFTNLTRDHLDYHGDEDAYFDAKARLFHPRFASTAVINMDDPRGPKLADLATDQGLVVWGFGSDRAPRRRTEHSIEIVSIDLGPHGFTAQLRVDTDPVELCSTLLGNFNVENATLALGMALAVGDPISTVLEGLRAPRLVPGRMQAIPARDRVAIVDYAHTPDALERVLRTARELGARVLVVFGCGGDRDRGKRPLMGAIAVDNADVVVVTSDNPRSEDPQAIVSEILEGLDRTQVTVQLDRAEAIRTAVEGSQPGDVIVIAGKGHEATQTIGDDVRVFDDAEVLKAAIQECGLAP
ncbi:MAG: UDP-N-acetylmuramoyl-L-alanyl-D-glutamate--2,6-diaminopimelate ligase, partial [Acidimicrobiia bacterium]